MLGLVRVGVMIGHPAREYVFTVNEIMLASRLQAEAVAADPENGKRFVTMKARPVLETEDGIEGVATVEAYQVGRRPCALGPACVRQRDGMVLHGAAAWSCMERRLLHGATLAAWSPPDGPASQRACRGPPAPRPARCERECHAPGWVERSAKGRPTAVQRRLIGRPP